MTSGSTNQEWVRRTADPKPPIYVFGVTDGIASIQDYLAIGRQSFGDIRTYQNIVSLNYRDVLSRHELSVTQGAAVFTDHLKLGGRSIEMLGHMVRMLPETVRVLNDPLTIKGRYEFLRVLYEAGINRHSVYGATERRPPSTWPVFVRGERGHRVSPLLYDGFELNAYLKRLIREGTWLGDKLIVEFNDYRSADGYYRKYSAFRIGERVFGGLLIVGHNWYLRSTLKDAPDMLSDPECLREELDHAECCVEADQVLAVFELAGIEYGRMDYAVCDGRIQVFEINTAPTLLKKELFEESQNGRRTAVALMSERMAEAFAALGSAHLAAEAPESATVAGNQR